mgnify:CR=1 FL=1
MAKSLPFYLEHPAPQENTHGTIRLHYKKDWRIEAGPPVLNLLSRLFSCMLMDERPMWSRRLAAVMPPSLTLCQK